MDNCFRMSLMFGRDVPCAKENCAFWDGDKCSKETK